MIAHYTRALVAEPGYAPSCTTWHDVPCPACNCPEAEPVVQAPGWEEHSDKLYAIVRCTNCGIWFTNPLPGGLEGAQTNSTSWHSAEARAAATLARCLPRNPDSGGWLFHFGSANKVLIETADRYGIKAVLWRERLADVPQAWWFAGGSAVFGSLEDVAEQCQGQASVITVCNWLEFQANLRGVLPCWRRLLRARGRLLLLVPNLSGIGFRRFNGLWRGLNLPHHRVHFSPRTLSGWLAEGGWRICSMRTYPCSAWLNESAQRWRQWSRPARWWQRWFWPLGTAASLAAWTSSWFGLGDWLIVIAEPRHAG